MGRTQIRLISRHIVSWLYLCIFFLFFRVGFILCRFRFWKFSWFCLVHALGCKRIFIFISQFSVLINKKTRTIVLGMTFGCGFSFARMFFDFLDGSFEADFRSVVGGRGIWGILLDHRRAVTMILQYERSLWLIGILQIVRVAMTTMTSVGIIFVVVEFSRGPEGGGKEG